MSPPSFELLVLCILDAVIMTWGGSTAEATGEAGNV